MHNSCWVKLAVFQESSVLKICKCACRLIATTLIILENGWHITFKDWI